MPSVPAAHDQPCATALGLEEELPHPVGVIAAMEPLQIAGATSTSARPGPTWATSLHAHPP